MTHRSSLVRHGFLAVAAYLVLPVVIAYLAFFLLPWRVIAVFQPDLAY